MSCGACWSRPTEDPHSQVEAWLSQQLKFAREQLDKKSHLCDQFSREMRRLQEDLDERRQLALELREQLNATNSELRAAAHAHAKSREEQEEATATLHARVDCLIRENESLESLCDSPVPREGAASHRIEGSSLSPPRGRSSDIHGLVQSHADEVARLRQRLFQEESVAAQSIRRAQDRWVEEAASIQKQTNAECALQHDREIRNMRADLAEDFERELRATESAASARAEASSLQLRRVEMAAREETRNLNRQFAHHEEIAERMVGNYAEEAASLRGEAMEANLELNAFRDQRKEEVDALGKKVDTLQSRIADLKRSESTALDREAKLQTALAGERQLHEETLRMLRAQRKEGTERSTALQHEMEQLSSMLEQKEDEHLTILFKMADLQNRMTDQAKLVMENADAFQTASEELADKDEKLEEILTEMQGASEEYSDKVKVLSQELEGRKASYKMLEEKAKAEVVRLETERDALDVQLQRLQTESAREVERLRQQLQAETQKAADQQAQLETQVADLQTKADGLAKQLGAQAAISAQAELCKAEALAKHREATFRSELESKSRENQSLTLKVSSAEAEVEDSAALRAQLSSKLAEETRRAHSEQGAAKRLLDKMEQLQQELNIAEDLATQRFHECRQLRTQSQDLEDAIQRERTGSSSLRSRSKEQVQLLQDRESSLQESHRIVQQRNQELEDEIAALREKTCTQETQLKDMAASLERSRLLERLADERAQEYQGALQIDRQFGLAGFAAASPRGDEEEEAGEAEAPR